LPAPKKKEEALPPLSFFCLKGNRTRTHLNAARMSAARDGSTERLLNFAPTGDKMQIESKLPAPYNYRNCDTQLRLLFFVFYLETGVNLIFLQNMPSLDQFPGWAFCIFRTPPSYKSLDLWGNR